MKKKWVTVSTAEHAPSRVPTVVQVGDRRIAIFKVGKTLYATDNACPHQGGPLADGRLEGEVIACPWHDWKYNVRTGCPVITPNLQTYPVRIHKNTLQIELEAGDVDATPIASREPADHTIMEKINLSRTLDDVVDAIYSHLQPVLSHNRLGLALLDDDGERLVQVKTRSDRPILLDNGFSANISGSSLKQLLDGGDARVIDDLKHQLQANTTSWTQLIVREGMRSSLTLPLRVQGRPIGVVFFSSIQPCAFSNDHIGFLQQIAGHLSILIEKGNWVSELAESHARYRTLFEMSNDGVCIFETVDTPLRGGNGNFASWLGYQRTDIERLTLTELLNESDVHQVSAVAKSLKSHVDSGRVEVQMRTNAGVVVPLELRLVRSQHRNRPCIVAFVRNLSEVKALTAQLHDQQSLDDMIGKSPVMQTLYRLIRQVAPMPTTVLISGESGTGKELVARAIHNHSRRATRPLITVNCGALSENLLESEWFGHEKGAFTGATSAREGRFEAADGGTIFLDEIGELSPATQVKLLRVLQQGEFQRVGSNSTQRVDVRVIAATNRDLKAEVEAGRFRQDLYYRLNVVQIELPPLRERKDDLPLLIRHFIATFNERTGKTIRTVSPDALTVLMNFNYPGNIRHLENIVEHAFVTGETNVIDVANLPADVRAASDSVIDRALMADNPLETLEDELIRSVLSLYNGDQHAAAQRLGISRTTMWRKLKRQQ